ncbi:hypothetical protein [Spirosoma rhododendri]|uniref:Uncharacterized protein n=1 Tax=Spirosoma rhododendri TaxID=2728024 RepID=A0A7L5DU82_9BACT|nr:hypothetical protein [Spirosoma rhododendri]QJD81645.1 hypothetical protein HH216_25210 [Spirosoma rhododendri]
MKEIAKKNRAINSAQAAASKSPSAQSKLDKANELLARVNPGDIDAIARKPVHS